MKIAVIEDDPVHAELLEGYLRSWSTERRSSIEVLRYSSAENFLFEWEAVRDFDALFVDIQMRQMNGMEMAKLVRKKDEKIHIIFTTGVTDYILEGYEVEAMHYLIKPISEEKIRECMDKVTQRRDDCRFLLVHTRDEVCRLQAEQINYIEAHGHGCIIEMAVKKKGGLDTKLLEVSESISELEDRVSSWGFVRCHRSYLCGLANVHQIGKTEILFDSGSHIPVSRRLRREVNQAFIRHFRRES